MNAKEERVQASPRTLEPMTLDRAQSLFYDGDERTVNAVYSTYFREREGACGEFHPAWFMAKEVSTIDDNTLVIVPLIEFGNENPKDGQGFQMVFYGNSDAAYPAELIAYFSDDSTEERSVRVDNCGFSGEIQAFTFEDCTNKSFYVEDGVITDAVVWTDYETCQQAAETRNVLKKFWDWLTGGGGAPCPNHTKSNKPKTKNNNGGNNNGGGHGDGNEGGGGWTIYLGGRGFPDYNSGSGNNTGSAGSGGGDIIRIINNIFDGDWFNGEGAFVISMLEDILAEEDLFICTETAQQILYHCLALEAAEDPESCNIKPKVGDDETAEVPFELGLDGYIRLLRQLDPTSPCLQELIDSYNSVIDITAGDGMLYCFVQENNAFDASDDDIFSIVKEKCQDVLVPLACRRNTFSCFGRLTRFQEEHGLKLNTSLINLAINSSESACDMTEPNFIDWLANEVINDSYGIYSNVFPLTGIEGTDDQLAMYFDDDERDNPSCDNCSVANKDIMTLAHWEAHDMIDCVIEKLTNYSPGANPDIKAALEANFNGFSSIIAAGYIKTMFQYIGFHLRNQSYQLELNGQGHCGSNTMAWSYPAVHVSDVRLCDPVFFNSTRLDQASTIIHESFHLYYIAGDWAYDWQPEYNDLNILQQLTNADAFSELAKAICDE